MSENVNQSENEQEQGEDLTTLTLTKLSRPYKEGLEKKVKGSGGKWDNLGDFVKDILLDLDTKGIAFFVALKKLDISTVIALGDGNMMAISKKEYKQLKSKKGRN